jgi:hypothetical protein
MTIVQASLMTIIICQLQYDYSTGITYDNHHLPIVICL